MQEKQYTIDILASMAERTIKRLWIIIIILLCLVSACLVAVVVENNARIDAINELRELENSIETVYEYEVEQEADDYGRNYVVSGDYYGEAKG